MKGFRIFKVLSFKNKRKTGDLPRDLREREEAKWGERNKEGEKKIRKERKKKRKEGRKKVISK